MDGGLNRLLAQSFLRHARPRSTATIISVSHRQFFDSNSSSLKFRPINRFSSSSLLLLPSLSLLDSPSSVDDLSSSLTISGFLSLRRRFLHFLVSRILSSILLSTSSSLAFSSFSYSLSIPLLCRILHQQHPIPPANARTITPTVQ